MENLYIPLDENHVELLKTQALIEHKSMEEILTEAMTMYLDKYFQERGYDLEVEEEIRI